MTNDTWSVINAVIASVAAIAGVAAAWASLRVYRKQTETDYPTVSAKFDDDVLVLRVENITGVEWDVASLRLPATARGNLLSALSKQDIYGDWVPLETSEQEKLMVTGTLPIGNRLHPAGVNSQFLGRGDLTWIRVVLQSTRDQVSLSLELLSCEAQQRRKVIKITRQVPTSARIAQL